MIDYDDIEEGKIITGISMSGNEVTGLCTNVMTGFRMVSVKCSEDRLGKEIIEFNQIREIRDAE